jgi:hypothetical protein
MIDKPERSEVTRAQDSPGAANGSHCGPNDAIAGEKLRLHVDPAQGLGGRDDGDVLEAFEAQ